MWARRLLHARATTTGSRAIRLRTGRALRRLVLRRLLPRGRLRLLRLSGTGLLLIRTRLLLACAGLFASLWLLAGLALLAGARLRLLLAGRSTFTTRGPLASRLCTGLPASTRLSGGLTALGSSSAARLTGSATLPLLARCRTRHAAGLSTVAETATGRLRGAGLMRVLTRLLFLANPLPDRRTRVGLALLPRTGTRAGLTALHTGLTGCPGAGRPVRGTAGPGPGRAGLHCQRGCGQTNQRNQSGGSYCRTHNFLPTDRGTLLTCRRHPESILTCDTVTPATVP
ncbi:hypothetical protein [Aquisalimonas asiatica]|uniref:Uncharacterized protein n=1 Tax=Aquisalimonas asiatica TaxID=406100 RepID=A0A1H8UMJ8_9GAMM|nr:hypothetical protein [Aquisalimonas asiatica]SEP04203.1 hypothetical protein SAMN04488052_10785 [Aquisalimonas asiatica]